MNWYLYGATLPIAVLIFSIQILIMVPDKFFKINLYFLLSLLIFQLYCFIKLIC